MKTIHLAIGPALVAATAVLLMLASPVRALGYTDPGTGTFVYQALYAAVIGGTFYIRKLIGRLFGKRSNR